MRPLLLAFSLALLLTTLTAACGDDRSARLGADGETCLVDQDCREDLLCEQRLCIDPLLGSGVDNTTDCQGVCAWIAECGLVESNCLSECLDETDRWSRDSADEAFTCLLSLSCAELSSSTETRACKALAQ